jgi:hypothetical protein
MLMPYIGGVGVYRQECDDIVADNYRGFEIRNASKPAERASEKGAIVRDVGTAG